MLIRRLYLLGRRGLRSKVRELASYLRLRVTLKLSWIVGLLIIGLYGLQKSMQLGTSGLAVGGK